MNELRQNEFITRVIIVIVFTAWLCHVPVHVLFYIVSLQLSQQLSDVIDTDESEAATLSLMKPCVE